MALSKNYNPQDYEESIYKKWMDNGVGKPENQSEVGSGSHTILMPPPNLTGNLHAGHAFQHFLMDTLSRVYRQRGDSTLWVPGVDHAGIQLEGVIDKMIKNGEADELLTDEVRNHIDYPADNDDLPKFLKKNFRDAWLDFAWKKVDGWRDFQKNQASLLGDTPDYSRNLFTLDERAVDMVNFAFQKYWEDNLIYKKSYLINWSVGLQTALSDVPEDIGRETRKDPFVTFEYEILSFRTEDDRFNDFVKNYIKDLTQLPRLRLSTVRIETKFTDMAVAMHPSKFDIYFNNDIFESGKEGFDQEIANEFLESIKNYEIKVYYHLSSLESDELQLIFHDKVDPDFGTGIVKITPGHDMFDYETFNLFVSKGVLQPQAIQIAVGRDGKLTEVAGEFAGLRVEESRPRVMKRLLETGYIPLRENYEGEGGDKGLALSDAEFNELSIEKQYQNLKNIYPEYQIDWDYEHNVTICERSKTVVEPLISEEFFLSYYNPTSRGGKTLRELGEEGINEVDFYSENFRQMGLNFISEDNLNDWVISRDLVWGHKMPVWYNLDTNPTREFYTKSKYDSDPEANTKFRISSTKPADSGNWVQETKILDTWFSSCLWPLSTLNYIESTQNTDWNDIPNILDSDEEPDGDFWKYYSTDEMVTAREIFYAWVVRMIILGKYFTGRIPFRKVVITPTIQDEKGRKMSKSLKNGLDPIDAINSYSSDSLRLALMGGMIPNRNMKMGGKLADNLLEKQRNFGNKLWNVARFLESKE